MVDNPYEAPKPEVEDPRDEFDDRDRRPYGFAAGATAVLLFAQFYVIGGYHDSFARAAPDSWARTIENTLVAGLGISFVVLLILLVLWLIENRKYRR